MFLLETEQTGTQRQVNNYTHIKRDRMITQDLLLCQQKAVIFALSLVKDCLLDLYNPDSY